MSTQSRNYELLKIYLEPRFGTIRIRWTDDLRTAVMQFLMHELPVDIFDRLIELQNDPSLGRATKESAATQLIETYSLDEMELAVCNAAIAAVPTLHQVIGDSREWPNAEARSQAIAWLDAHELGTGSHETVWTELARHSRYAFSLPADHVLPEDLVEVLSPAELIPLVETYIGPAPSDLTDEEWQLLQPHFRLRKTRTGERPLTEQELHAKRDTFNGIRYKMAKDIPWSRVPSRYGKPLSIYQAYNINKANGLFAQVYDALHGNEAAVRLVEWLGQITGNALKG